MSLFPARLPLFSPGELSVGAQAGVWKLAHTVCEIRCPNKLFVSALCRLANQYAVELHKKIAISVACLVFVQIGRAHV